MRKDKKKREELPKINPLMTCFLCQKEYPIWGHYFNTGENSWKVGHNFVPTTITLNEGGILEIKEVCIDCKIQEIVKRWK